MGLQAVGGAVGAYGAMQQGRAQASYYGFLANQSRLESGLATATADRQAADTEKAASYTEEIMARNESKALGAQRAGFGANGIAGSVTAQDITKSTMDAAELDKQAVRFNADSKANAAKIQGAMSAFNYDSQATGYDMAGKNALTASKYNATATILGTSGSLASQWYRYQS
jgi:hypothetical protein